MEKLNFILISVGLAVFMSGCGSSSSGGQTGAIACANGTVAASGTVCTANVGPLVTSSTRVGYFTQSSNFPWQPADAAGSSMTLGSGYQNLLQNAMGVCNQQAYSGGLAACPAWQQGYQDMVIILDSTAATQAEIVIRSYPYINPNSDYYYSFPSVTDFFASLLGLTTQGSYPVYDPLVLTTTVWPINNSTGFELRANGPTDSGSWWSLIQFQVKTGTIGAAQIPYTLYMDGGNQQMVTVASGTMNLCETQNCGIPGL